MNSLLFELYNGDYDVTPKLDKAQEEINRNLCVLLEQIQEQLGLDTVDQLTGLYAQRGDLSDFRYYREGFRLGVQLMLEVFMPA